MSLDAALTRVITLLQIRSGELRKVALVAALFALLELGRSAGGSAADALFFLRFGVENLPYMFIGLGLANFVFSLSYAAFLGRFNKGRFFLTLLAIMAVLLMLEREALVFELRALYPILWLTINIVGALLGTLMWNTAGEVCDARQAKRLFPLFVSAALLGGLVGSVVIGPVAHRFGAENLIIMDVFLLLLAAVLIRAIALEFFRPTPKYTSSFLADVRAGYDVVRRSAMLKMLAASAVLFSLLYFSVSFPFGQALSASSTGEADVAAFLGLLNGIGGVLTFLVSLFVANRLYARLGVVNALLLLPVTYLLGFVLFALNFSLTTAVIVRLSQLLVMNGIGDGAYGTFFNVVPVEKRAQVRAFDSGVPSQIGTILSGVMLILGQRVLTTTQIFLMGMFVALACTYTVLRMRRGYANALIAALRAGRYEVFTTGGRAFSGLSKDAIQVASGALSDPRPTTRQLAVEMLARMGARSVIPALIQILHDPDAETRQAAIRALADFGAREALEPLTRLLDDPEPQVRVTALAALGRLQPPLATVSVMTRLLSDPDIGVHIGAAAILIDFDRDGEALAVVESLLQDPDPAVRIQVLTALGRLIPRVAFNHQLILQTLADESPAVRRAACGVLGSLDQADIQAALLKCLDDDDHAVRMAAAVALHRPDSAVVPQLFERLESGSAQAREAALMALTPQPRSPSLYAYAQRELDELREWQILASAVQPAGRASKMLRDSLETQVTRSQQRLIQVVGLLGNPETMELIGKSLTENDDQTRAAAIEALDTLGDKRLAKQLILLVEVTPEQQAASPLPPEEAICRLITIQADDHAGQAARWLRRWAVRSSGEIGLRGLIPDVRTCLDDPDPLVCEAAQAALVQLEGLEEDVPMKTLQTISLMERILFLREVPLFADLSSDDLSQVAEVAYEHLYEPGSILCKEGDEGHELFIIIDGHVRIFKTESGTEKHLAMRGAGDFFGEMAIIEASPRSATAQADDNARLLVIDGNAFKSILRDRPEVSLAMLRSLSRRLREAR